MSSILFATRRRVNVAVLGEERPLAGRTAALRDQRVAADEHDHDPRRYCCHSPSKKCR